MIVPSSIYCDILAESPELGAESIQLAWACSSEPLSVARPMIDLFKHDAAALSFALECATLCENRDCQWALLAALERMSLEQSLCIGLEPAKSKSI